MAAWLVLAPAVAISGGAGGDPEDDDRVEDEIVFQLVAGDQLDAVLADHQLSFVDQAAGLFTYVAAAASGSTDDHIDAIVAQMMLDTARVRAAEPHRLAEAPELRPSAAQFRTIALADQDATLAEYLGQAALQHIGQAQATWDGAGVLVAVLDTGVGPHPLLDSVIVPGRDFIDEDDDASDLGDDLDNDGDSSIDEGVGHGTHVAGIIHAVAPRAQILPVRVMDSEGQGSVFAIARGIRYAVDRGAGVINLSLGLLNDSTAIEDALEYAEGRAIIVVSAGNDARGEPIQFPAGSSKVISVAATDLQDRKADFSNFNGRVAIAAPGVSILSLYTTEQAEFATWTGTSMAAPFVSGAMALAREARPDFTTEGIEDLVVDSSLDISSLNPQFEDSLGEGRLDIARLMAVLPAGPPPVPARGNPVLETLLVLAVFSRLRKIRRIGNLS